jgi:hypothetical protein
MSRIGTLDANAAGRLNLLLGAALLLTSISVFFRPRILKWTGHHIHALEPERLRWWTVLLGMILGVLVSVTSVGAGALGTTALLILYPRLPVARIAASDIAHAVPLTLIAGVGHWLIGSVDLSLMIALLAGSIPGVIIGSLLSGRSSDVVLRPVLAVTLLVVAVKMLFGCACLSSIFVPSGSMIQANRPDGSLSSRFKIGTPLALRRAMKASRSSTAKLSMKSFVEGAKYPLVAGKAFQTTSDGWSGAS